VVIYNFYIFCTLTYPVKAYPPLIVDANAVLTGTITPECFEMIAWRHLQVIESNRDIELAKFASRNLANIRESFNMVTL